jgi:hypothetical protein
MTLTVLALDLSVKSTGFALWADGQAKPVSIRHCAVHQATWRRHFLGAMPRGVKTADYKHMAMTKCRELGFEVIKHDAAEACGLLDYQLSIEGIIAPWREGILQRQMTPATDGRRAQA